MHKHNKTLRAHIHICNYKGLRMTDQEKQIAIIEDIIIPADVNTRYDLIFTDKRIGIVCMGNVDRFAYGVMKLRTFPSTSSAVTPSLTYVDNEDKIPEIEEEVSAMSLSDILKLSKKSGQYSYSEIEQLRLVWGKKPKFAILSADCESKFAPDPDQFKQLIDLLMSVEPLSSKLEVAGNWKELQTILARVVCGNCGVENDLDAVWCVNCGQKIRDLIAVEADGVTCSLCLRKNRAESAFCKQCGEILTKKDIAD
jgi:hypothetical protein